jgi:hypothetical protein
VHLERVTIPEALVRGKLHDPPRYSMAPTGERKCTLPWQPFCTSPCRLRGYGPDDMVPSGRPSVACARVGIHVARSVVSRCSTRFTSLMSPIVLFRVRRACKASERFPWYAVLAYVVLASSLCRGSRVQQTSGKRSRRRTRIDRRLIVGSHDVSGPSRLDRAN